MQLNSWCSEYFFSWFRFYWKKIMQTPLNLFCLLHLFRRKCGDPSIISCSFLFRALSVTPLAGLFTHHLENAVLVIPRKVNHQGELISHQLTHHHHHHHDDHHREYQNKPPRHLDRSVFDEKQHDDEAPNQHRVRRSPASIGEAADGKLHYHVDVEDQTLHLELEWVLKSDL